MPWQFNVHFSSSPLSLSPPPRVVQEPGRTEAESGSPSARTVQTPRLGSVVDRMQLQRKSKLDPVVVVESPDESEKYLWESDRFFFFLFCPPSLSVERWLAEGEPVPHCTTHRLGTDTRTQLPREGRRLTNWVLQRSVATAANSGGGSPRGVKGLMPCADWPPLSVTSGVRHFEFGVTFAAMSSLFKTKAIIYISARNFRVACN